MIHKEIIDAIDRVMENIPENEFFKARLRSLIENALTKTQERSFRDNDVRELLELDLNDEDELEFEEDGGEVHAG